MASLPSLNLIYSTNRSRFLEHIRGINKNILEFKQEGTINDFTADDEREIGRGQSYAVFPDLKNLVKNGGQITIFALREQLINQKVVDTTFQNKIISLILQGKAGIQFTMGNVLNQLFLNEDTQFLLDNNDYDIRLEVKDHNKVTLLFNGNCMNIETGEATFNYNIAINITPEKVVIDAFKVTQIAENEQADNAFSFLKEHQANFLQKFITWIKIFFNRHKDIELENAHDPLPANVSKNSTEMPVGPIDDDQPVDEKSFSLK